MDLHARFQGLGIVFMRRRWKSDTRSARQISGWRVPWAGFPYKVGGACMRLSHHLPFPVFVRCQLRWKEMEIIFR